MSYAVLSRCQAPLSSESSDEPQIMSQDAPQDSQLSIENPFASDESIEKDISDDAYASFGLCSSLLEFPEALLGESLL